MYTQVIGKIGNSEGVIIPRNILAALGFKCGTAVDIEVIDDQLILKSARRKPTLEELVAQMTPENEHPEVCAGLDVGAEVVEYEPKKEAARGARKTTRKR